MPSSRHEQTLTNLRKIVAGVHAGDVALYLLAVLEVDLACETRRGYKEHTMLCQ